MNKTDLLEGERTELGELNDIGAIETLMSVRGLNVVDVGCGPGRVSRELCARGATVLGVEPDPLQAEKNRQSEAMPGFTFVEAGAEALPVQDNSVDGVFFFRSLHHVPQEHMEAALEEAARVLKPETGFLWVVEPAMYGAHHNMMKPFHDETKVGAAAQAALARKGPTLFREMTAYRYVECRRYVDFEAMAKRLADNTFNDIRREDVETDEVRALFKEGRLSEGEYVFEQPMLLNLYRHLL
ncbi:MAG: class I SAM-dependent methyltransferase [Parvibaculum sp.]